MAMKVKLGGGDSFRYDGNDGFGEEKIPVIRRAVTSNVEGKLRLLAGCFGGREVTLTALDHHSARGRRYRVGQPKKDSGLTDGTSGQLPEPGSQKEILLQIPQRECSPAGPLVVAQTRFGTLGSRTERAFVLV